MSAKISARVRAQAITLLRCAADATWLVSCNALELDISCPPRVLAWDAFIAACSAIPWVDDPDLEAAALLEDGWCPGDPVEVRR